jgi:RNA polymerase sigma factor (sigma-70 family)
MMRATRVPDNPNSTALELSDAEVLALFHQDPERAWGLFIERYADVILSDLHHLGFDYDQAMDRFMYICEKLCEGDFRRLKTIRYAGSYGDLLPWVRQAVKHLCINWAWSAEGRKRLFKSIARLPVREQRIFELYFWKGLSPSEIYEHLRLDHQPDIELTEVFEALEHIFSHLSQKKLWRLMSNLARRRGTCSLEEIDAETGIGFDPVDARPNPEEALIQKQTEEQINRALDGLSPRERLLIQFRYEEGMAIKEIADMLHVGEREVKSSLKVSVEKLRRAVK